MKDKLPKNPMQPVIKNQYGTYRFKDNAIVRFLLDHNVEGKKIDLNTLAGMEFSQDDEIQFAQLIGYSVIGFHELSYVSDNAAKAASELVRKTFGLDPDVEVGCRDTGCEIHSGVDEE